MDEDFYYKGYVYEMKYDLLDCLQMFNKSFKVVVRHTFG